MKIYKALYTEFLKNKSNLDMLVFWRKIDEQIVEIKPICKYARLIVEKIAI